MDSGNAFFLAPLRRAPSRTAKSRTRSPNISSDGLVDPCVRTTIIGVLLIIPATLPFFRNGACTTIFSGGQQGLLSIHMQKRFLTWNKAPSEAQVECLRAALDGSMEPLSVSVSSRGWRGGGGHDHAFTTAKKPRIPSRRAPAHPAAHAPHAGM